MDKGRLIIHVNILGCESVKSAEQTVNFVTFDGYADGGLFEGSITPAGTDVQLYNESSGQLSARYMLKGHDYTGAPCRIYIDNKAEAGQEKTYPTVITDSKALAFLQERELEGRLFEKNGGLIIEISTAEK